MSSQQKSKLPSVSATDRALFRKTISDTTHIPDSDAETNSDLENSLPRSNSKDTSTSNTGTTRGILSRDGDLFYRPGVQKNTLKNLKRGRFEAQAEIDLHGCTRREASRYLQSFLSQCHTEQLNCVRVVTGKGRSSPGHHSIIRETTLASLRHEARVLAYSSAPPNDGGSGAFYVLLSS
jgi:DNA-nicking Smr family endonuclease